MHNSEIAAMFEETADLLEIQGANPFRIRAYRNAGRTVKDLSQSIEEMVKNKADLSALPGIGKDLAGKINSIVNTGRFATLEDLKKTLPPELGELMKISGLGAKRTKAVYDRLNVRNIEDLEEAAKEGKIRGLPGFGEKTEKSILEGIEGLREAKGRALLSVADELSSTLVKYLKRGGAVLDIEIAGSNRRRRETVGDLDILATVKKGSKIMEKFVRYGGVVKVVSKGDTKSTVILRSGMQVDLRVVPRESYGAALHYFTGSQAHNIAVRAMGVKKGLKINEYGVFKGNKSIGGKNEEEVFASVGLPYIPPELREDRGEIAAAIKKQLPDLLTVRDIKGDLHSHTKLTDGAYSLKEMVDAARAKGYEYIGISDHSKRLTITNGLDERRLAAQIEEIDRLNEKMKDIVILKSIELDIMEDGSLDLPDEILKELDFTICSVHYKFNLSSQEQTERIIRAMDNTHFNILAHPTGRLLNERKPYEVNMERILKAARERGCIMELNAHPMRLDLNDIHCRMAKDMGVSLAISTDAHTIKDLDYMEFGVGQARRGWIEPENVINTRSLKELKKLIKRK